MNSAEKFLKGLVEDRPFLYLSDAETLLPFWPMRKKVKNIS